MKKKETTEPLTSGLAWQLGAPACYSAPIRRDLIRSERDRLVHLLGAARSESRGWFAALPIVRIVFTASGSKPAPTFLPVSTITGYVHGVFFVNVGRARASENSDAAHDHK